MERVCKSLKSRIQTAYRASQIIKSGMTIAMSGFTVVGYPQAVPLALADSGHATELTLLVSASAGDQIDGTMSRAGIVSRRYPFQNHKDMRRFINKGDIKFQDMHLSDFARLINQGRCPEIDVAVIECVAVTEDGIIPPASVGASDAFVRAAKRVILEVNHSIPLEFAGLHDIYEVGKPPYARPIPILSAGDRIGTPFIPCPPEKIAAIILTNDPDQTPKFREIDENSRKVGQNVVQFLKDEICAGRLPGELPPIQSGLGSVGNAILFSLAESGFSDLSLYTEVMQDGGLKMIENGVLGCVSSTALSLSEMSREKFYDELSYFKEKIILRPQEISNHPEVIRRLGVIAINTPIEADIYGNVNSTHVMGTSMMNGVGGSGDFTRNSGMNIYTTDSRAKGGLISCIVPMVSHVDQTEHDVHVIITEQGVADLRWKCPQERAELIIENCAHPEYRPLLRDYLEEAKKVSLGQHTPHDLRQALSWHQRYLETGSMMPGK